MGSCFFSLYKSNSFHYGLSAGLFRLLILIMHSVLLVSVVALVGLCFARPANEPLRLVSLGPSLGFPAEYLPSGN